MSEKIRVLVVDDSALMRKKISDMINSDVDIEVVGTARSSEEVLRAVPFLKPDVITMDIQMPGMDGITCVGYIMSEFPTPVVMLSAFTHYGSEMTIKALEYGAVDFVLKPSGVISLDIHKVRDELLNKIKIAARVSVDKLKLKLIEKRPAKGKPSRALNKVVIIGASTGGPRALAEIIPRFSSDIPAGILVIQHMPEEFTRSMAERLDSESNIKVKEAEDGEPILPGKALVAPGGYHMKVEKSGAAGGGEVIHIEEGLPEKWVCPSINVTMRSAAPIYKDKAIGVLLTGMGSDGVEGLEMIKSHGGKTLAEDESTCIVYGMPRSAIEAHVVDRVVPLDKMTSEIEKLVKN